MQSASPVIAIWDVAGETYKEMYEDAIADTQIFLHGLTSQDTMQLEVLNCEPLEFEDSRIIKWKGKAIITYRS